MNSAPLEEIDKMVEIIKTNLSKEISGEESILWMKKHSSNWKQMEWMGFYFESYLFKQLTSFLGGEQGPKFGNTKFDYKNKYVWDFKTHSKSNPNGINIPWTVMNDKSAIECCIKKFGGVGFIIAEIDAIYDTDLSFKNWHDSLKGKKSNYVLKREKEGARKRMRKKSIKFSEILFIYFSSLDELKEGYARGWLKNFQEGMRNSNDTPRAVKIQLNISNIPDKFIIKRIKL
jgi:hypothetical protein